MQVNQEIARLRPEVDKIRSDTRHEKGMVSVSKKQLEKSETERDAIQSGTDNYRSTPVTSPPIAPSRELSNLASPVGSVQSQNTNPFFRKSPQQSFDNTTAPSAFARSPAEDPNKFGNIWGTAFTSSPATAAPPPTSFGGFSKQTESEPSEQNVPTPSASPPTSSYRDSPRATGPPELPESRQITASDLPIRGAGNASSPSMKVEAPASRWEGTVTPTAASTAVAAPPAPEPPRQPEMTSTGAAMFDRAKSTSPVASTRSDASRSKVAEQNDIFRSFPAATSSIPGAFPGSTSSPLQSNLTGESSFTSGSKDTSRTETFSAFSTGSQGPSRAGTSASKGDFDAAFASLGGSTQQRQATGPSANGAVDPVKKAEHQFPPIEINEEDSEDSERGFDDDFTIPSPEGKKAVRGLRGASRAAPSQEKEDDFFQPRTATAASVGDLPPITAQKSPPTYEQAAETASTSGAGAAREANKFPPEFGGLLPQRETAASPQTVQSASQGAALFGSSGGGYFTDPLKPTETPSSSTVPSGDYHSAVSQPSATTDKSTGQTSQSLPGGLGKSSFGSFGGNDDFDTGFDELEDARADDGKEEEDFFGTSRDHSFEGFNPSFDSPAASKSNTLASDFDSSIGNMKSSTMSTSTMGAPKSASASHNWDDLMKGIDSPSASKASTEFAKSSPFPDLSASGSGGASSSSKPFGDASTLSFPEAPEPPKLGRALTEGTEHDDPILKQLTGMGYDRKDALDALEKYDYNVDKVRSNPRSRGSADSISDEDTLRPPTSSPARVSSADSQFLEQR